MSEEAQAFNAPVTLVAFFLFQACHEMLSSSFPASIRQSPEIRQSADQLPITPNRDSPPRPNQLRRLRISLALTWKLSQFTAIVLARFVVPERWLMVRNGQ